ncbi:Tim17/Tim22/Tim23/Pmp24 family domain containing protein [Naviculisporaceae sp. PSN 640]
MSVWDAITGRKNKPAQTPPPAPAPTATEPHHVSSSPFDPSAAQGVDAFLGTSSFADPSVLHPLAGLNKETLDYISLEEGAIATPGSQAGLPSRGFTDDLCYGTGITYLSGLTIGGAWGLQEGLRRSVDQPPKLRLNSVLNSITRRGPFLGNSAGVVAICYNFFNLGFSTLRGGKQDSLNTIAAGVLSGMVFKSTRGLRTMMISGGIVGTIAGAWAITKRTLVYASSDQTKELRSL